MRRTLAILFLIVATARGAHEPFMAESKIQSDLENMLSRLIPREEFLVQVNAEIVTRTERRLVEGETTSEIVRPEPEIRVEAMPGFTPEAPADPTKPAPQQQRQVYRIVDIPEVKSIRVHASFDEGLAPPTVMRAKTMIQAYMTGSFPNLGSVTFSQIPMLKPPKPEKTPAELELEKIAKEEKKKKEKEKQKPPEPTWEEKIWNERILILLGAIFIALLLLARKPKEVGRPRREAPERRPRFARMPPLRRPPAMPSFDQASPPPPAAPSVNRALLADVSLSLKRRKLLDRFLQRSEIFRAYYQTLTREARDELYSVVRGPAFDSFLDGLHVPRPAGDIPESHETEDVLEEHEKNFEEFVHAKDWQSKQFFGFLHQLNDDQLVGVVNHETPLAACMMLRFLRAEQSAKVLDALPDGKRIEVLSHLPELEHASFAQMSTIEREVRSMVQNMPTHAFGAKKEEISYWGSVVAESEHQDELLHDFEQTQPEIYLDIKKYKFSLEDASSLPDSLLDKVLSSVDNEELALALATCRDDVTTVILDAVSPKRRELLQHYVASAKNAPKEQTRAARQSLSKKFREVMT